MLWIARKSTTIYGRYCLYKFFRFLPWFILGKQVIFPQFYGLFHGMSCLFQRFISMIWTDSLFVFFDHRDNRSYRSIPRISACCT